LSLFNRKDGNLEKSKVGTEQVNNSEVAQSITSCPLSIVSAVRFADTILGEGRIWNPDNDIQKGFINDHLVPYGELTTNLKEIESIAAWEAGIINDFLKKKGFTIQLDEFDKDEFGVASVLDLLVEWLVKGDQATINTPDNSQFPGVGINKHGVTFHTVSEHPNPVACLQTKDQYNVYLTMLDKPPTEMFSLFEKAVQFSSSLSYCSDFEGLEFPMVDLRQQTDISWLLGMGTSDEKGDPWFISQALQENRLRMNEIGARAQSATAIGVKRGIAPLPKPVHIINEPFLIWFMRPDIPIPLFVGYIVEADWKNPGDIESI